MKATILLFVMCVLVSLAGCVVRESKAPPKAQSTVTSDQPVEKKAETAVVELKPAKVADFTKTLEAHKGKVVVVDFWATWCPPCMANFHHLVELHHKYKSKDVVCISVSLDDLDSKERALKFLTKEKSVVANFIPDGDKAKWMEDWQTSVIPVVLVFDSAGKLDKRFETDPDAKVPFTYDDVEKTVKTLLKK